MAVAIRLPDMGTNVEECKVLSWRVKPGDTVKRGDVLADIETDKAVAELESTGEGVLLEVVVHAGGPARTGDVLAYLGKPGEAVPGEAQSSRSYLSADGQPESMKCHSERSEESCSASGRPLQKDRGEIPRFARNDSTFQSSAAVAPAALPRATAPSKVTPSQQGSGPSLRIAPVVRNLAAKLGVDLARVQGTGVGGVITREDVLRAARRT